MKYERQQSIMPIQYRQEPEYHVCIRHARTNACRAAHTTQTNREREKTRKRLT